MKLLFRIVLFMLFFNIAAFMVSAMNIFPNSLYGDATHYNLDDPTNLPTPEQMFDNLLLNNRMEITKIIGFDLEWNIIIGGILVVVAAVAALTHSSGIISIGFTATMFVFMYTNSKSLFDGLAADMGHMTGYIALMLGLGVFVLVIITIMDYASGQTSAGG